MGALQGFFQMCLVLTALLFAVNITLTSFGPTMTGMTPDEFLGLDTNMSVDLNTTTSATTSEGKSIWNVIVGTIKQVTGDIAEAVIDITGWTTLNIILRGFVNGWSVILEKIFVDELEPIGSFLWLILNIIQVMGAAYLPFAILSAWKGGGSP